MDGAESQALMVLEPATAPAVMVDFDEAGVDMDEEYGEIIKRTEGSNKSRLGDINTEGRLRSSLLTSSASSLPYHIPRFRDWYPRVPIQYRTAFTFSKNISSRCHILRRPKERMIIALGVTRSAVSAPTEAQTLN
jgi:hypothetical protein